MSLSIDLGNRSYEVTVERGLLGRIVEELHKVNATSNILIVTDETVRQYYLNGLTEQLQDAGQKFWVATIPDGEGSKSIDFAQAIWDNLANSAADRETVVVALGGGVVGDLAGFVAATYARGLRFVQLPTSLLAQVDSSVGGKVGINLEGGKNLVGAFWQPIWVGIDPDCLKTLDDRNYAAGLAEVVKYGMIQDRKLFEYLESNVAAIRDRDPDVLKHIIMECCRCKAEIVEEDETETTGRRAILNYGHTIGHAIENVFGYGTYLHGEAISIGMHYESLLALRKEMITVAVVQRQGELLRTLGLPITCQMDQLDQIIAATKSDKKASAGKVRYVLPTEIGNVTLVDDIDEGFVAHVLGEIESIQTP